MLFLQFSGTDKQAISEGFFQTRLLSLLLGLDKLVGGKLPITLLTTIKPTENSISMSWWKDVVIFLVDSQTTSCLWEGLICPFSRMLFSWRPYSFQVKWHFCVCDLGKILQLP